MTRKWYEGLLSLTVAVLALAMPIQAAEWEKLPPLPAPNGGFVSGVLDGKIWIIGGTNWEGGEKHWLSRVHVFDPVRRQWTGAPDFDSPVAYAIGGNVRLGGGFGFAGGFTGSAGNPLQWWLSKPSQWSNSKGLPASESRVLAAGGVIDDTFIIVGGTDDPANIAGFERTAISLSRNGKIETLPDFPGKPFGTAASAVVADSLFIFAGAHWTGANQDVVNTDEAYALSMTTRSWRKIQSFPYAVRGLSAVALSDSVIYLAGGYKNDDEGFTDEGYLYDIVDDTYTPSAPIPYKALVGLVICEGYLYCLGGEDKKQSRSDAAFRLPIASLLKLDD